MQIQMAPSFYKILLDTSSCHLSLPLEFVRVNKIPNAPIIRSANGGYSWRLKIQQIGDNYCFANGWNNVVKDIHLGFGDFLFFRLVDQSTFRMSIYSPNGCEKILPPKIEEHDDEDEKNEDDDDDPFFVCILKKTHQSVLRFPGGFAELAGIDGEGTMTVKDPDGVEWVMRLKVDTTFRSKRYLLSSGWSGFRRRNELSEGDECVFKFIRSENKLLLARVTKKNRHNNKERKVQCDTKKK